MDGIWGIVIFHVIFLFLCMVLPLFIFYKIGKYSENKHYASIHTREASLIHLAFTPSDTVDASRRVEAIALVTGQVVIGADPFKRYVAGLMSLVGGRITSFEAPLDRARREAILRMKEHAVRMKADEVVNFRMETSSICGGQAEKPIGIVEVVAYGTAIKYVQER